jgi:hypothetical protein
MGDMMPALFLLAYNYFLASESSIVFYNSTFIKPSCVDVNLVRVIQNTFARASVDFTDSIVSVPYAYETYDISCWMTCVRNWWSVPADSFTLLSNTFNDSSALRISQTRFVACPVRSSGSRYASPMTALTIGANNHFNESRLTMNKVMFSTLPAEVKSFDISPVFEQAYLDIDASPSGSGITITSTTGRGILSSSLALYDAVLTGSIVVQNLMLNYVAIANMSADLIQFRSITTPPDGDTQYIFNATKASTFVFNGLARNPIGASLASQSLTQFEFSRVTFKSWQLTNLQAPVRLSVANVTAKDTAISLRDVLLSNMIVTDCSMTSMTFTAITVPPNPSVFTFVRTNLSSELRLDGVNSSLSSVGLLPRSSEASVTTAFTNVNVTLLRLYNFATLLPRTVIRVDAADIGEFTVSGFTAAVNCTTVELRVQTSRVVNILLNATTLTTCAAVSIIISNVSLEGNAAQPPVSIIPRRIALSWVKLANYIVLFDQIALRMPYAYRSSSSNVVLQPAIDITNSSFMNGSLCASEVDFLMYTGPIRPGYHQDVNVGFRVSSSVTLDQTTASFTGLRFSSTVDNAIAWNALSSNTTTVRFAVSGRGGVALRCSGVTVAASATYSLWLRLISSASIELTQCTVGALVVASSNVSSIVVEGVRFVENGGGVRIVDSVATQLLVNRTVFLRGGMNAIAITNSTFGLVKASELWATSAASDVALVLYQFRTSRLSLSNVDFSQAIGRSTIVLRNFTISLPNTSDLVQLDSIRTQGALVEISHGLVSAVRAPGSPYPIQWTSSTLRNSTVSVCNITITNRSTLGPSATGIQIRNVSFETANVIIAAIEVGTLSTSGLRIESTLLTTRTTLTLAVPINSTTLQLRAASTDSLIRLNANTQDNFESPSVAVTVKRDVNAQRLQYSGLSLISLASLATQSRARTPFRCTWSPTPLWVGAVESRYTLGWVFTPTAFHQQSASSSMKPTASTTEGATFTATLTVSSSLSESRSITATHTAASITSTDSGRFTASRFSSPTLILLQEPQRPTAWSDVVALRAVGLDAETAVVVQVSTSGAAVLAAWFFPPNANKAAGVSRVTGLLQCGEVTSDSGIEPPSMLALLPGIPFMTAADPAHDGAVKNATGIVSTSLLFVAMFVASLYVARKAHGEIDQEAKPIAFVNAAMGIALGYYSPNIVASGLTVVLHSSDNLAVLIGGAGALFVTVFIIWLAWLTDHYGDEWMNPNPAGLGPRLYALWQPLYDEARDMSRPLVKLHTFEDTGIAVMIAALSAIYPKTVGGCRILSGIVTALAIGHLVYLAFLKPYNKLVEQRLATLNALLLLVASMLTLVLLFSDPADTSDDDWRVTVLGYTILVLEAAFVIQSVFLVGLSAREWMQKRNNPSPKSSVPLLQQGLLTKTTTLDVPSRVESVRDYPPDQVGPAAACKPQMASPVFDQGRTDNPLHFTRKPDYADL